MYGACIIVAVGYFIRKSIRGVRETQRRWDAFWREFAKISAGNNQ